MKKVCIIGHFGFGYDLLNGQTIKTKIVSAELKNVLGCDDVMEIDTHGGLSFYFKLPFLIFSALLKCRNVIIMPAHNGLRVIAPLLAMLNIFFRRNTHYIVIGGWMPSLISKKTYLRRCLKKFSHIYVETSVMEAALRKMNFSNVEVMLNCKPLDILAEDELDMTVRTPMKFCTFSRVMKQKGIEHAINVIKKLNENCGENTCCLDIYGQVDEQEISWFDDLQRNFPKGVAYRGFVSFDKSVETLKCYDALIFPTLFFTEGIPGTIIDAYAAGVPVISSKWESFSDVVDDNIVGFGYQFASQEALYGIIEKLLNEPALLLEKKKACVEKAKIFLPCNAMKVLIKNLD